MQFSWWNQYFEYSAETHGSVPSVSDSLLEHYRNSARSFHLESQELPHHFAFRRGSVLMSALGAGSELWLRHRIRIAIGDASDGRTQIKWSINLKVFGLRAGSNAIVKECEQLAARLDGRSESGTEKE